MSYRDKFYSEYVSTQTSLICGEQNLNDIKKQFIAWQSFYGKFLPKKKDVKILEIGCGNGGFIYWLQSLGFQNASGIDISKEQIAQAEKMGVKNIVQADIKEFLKNKKEFYDIIFARDVLEHFNKEEILDVLKIIFDSLKNPAPRGGVSPLGADQGVLRRQGAGSARSFISAAVHRAHKSMCSVSRPLPLKNGGLIILQVPNAESPFGGRYRYWDFTHEISFTEPSIRQILLVSGFKNVLVYQILPVIHGLKSLARFILWKIIGIGLRFYLLVETGSSKGNFSQNIIVKAEK